MHAAPLDAWFLDVNVIGNRGECRLYTSSGLIQVQYLDLPQPSLIGGT